MSTSDFDNRLGEALDFSTTASDPYGQAYAALTRIAGGIEGQMNEGLPKATIKIEIEPGFQATIGQQLNVVLHVPGKQFRTTLFRAYIPERGMPVNLDLFGEEPEPCENERELQEKILAFLQKTRDGMSSYREYARR